MSVRLNDVIRAQILEAVLQHAFGEREKKLAAERLAMGDYAYKDVYDAKLRRQMAAMPAGFLPENDDLGIQFEGIGFTRLPLAEPRRIADSHRCGAAKVYDSDHQLTLRYRDRSEARDAVGAERREARIRAKTVLGSVTTVKKLIEVWPEVRQFAEPWLVESPSRALALPIQDLNRALGLPPEEKHS